LERDYQGFSTNEEKMKNILRKAKNKDGSIQYMFVCLGCDEWHGVKVPDWTFNGDMKNPTFSPSLLVTYGKDDPRKCHSIIKNGEIRYLSDCTHKLAGTTVKIPEIQED